MKVFRFFGKFQNNIIDQKKKNFLIQRLYWYILFVDVKNTKIM